MSTEEKFLRNLYTLLTKLKERNMFCTELPNGYFKSTVDVYNINDEINFLYKIQDYGFIYKLISLGNTNKCVERFSYEYDSNFDVLFDKYVSLFEPPYFISWSDVLKLLKSDFKRGLNSHSEVSLNKSSIHKYDKEISLFHYKHASFKFNTELGPIKFFLVLYEFRGKTLLYKQIAEKINKGLEEDQGNEKNMDFSKIIHYLKRDLKKALLTSGYEGYDKHELVDEIIDLIKPVNKQGYRLDLD